MEKFISFVVVVILIGFVLLLIWATATAQVYESQISATQNQLKTIAETMLASKDEEVLVECRTGPTFDAWDTQIRPVYVSTSDVIVVVALSAGLDTLWETDDDLSVAAHKPGIFD